MNRSQYGQTGGGGGQTHGAAQDSSKNRISSILNAQKIKMTESKSRLNRCSAAPNVALLKVRFMYKHVSFSLLFAKIRPYEHC
jgi:hypothetical protein